MITEEQYKAAVAQQSEAEKAINKYNRQQDDDFKERWARFGNGEIFKDEDLVYSAHAICEKCGVGLAYPKACGLHHQWTCSAVLKGIGTDKGHSAFPFSFYEIKSENQPSANGASTRPKPE